MTLLRQPEKELHLRSRDLRMLKRDGEMLRDLRLIDGIEMSQGEMITDNFRC